MRHLYEFSKDGYRYRASALETSHAGLDVWIEGDGLFPASEWIAADPETDPEAFEAAARELLKVARILDSYDELASALLLDWPHSLEALLGRDGEGFIFKAKLQRLLGRHTVVVERRGEGETE